MAEIPDRLPLRVLRALETHHRTHGISRELFNADPRASSVLVLLTSDCATGAGKGVPCLILNRRSRQVRQGGDLCFPGGGVSPRLDSWLAGLVRLPGLPLSRWPYRFYWKRHHPEAFGRIAKFLATSLRESAEEIRLNPLRVRFLGPLPPQQLVMFRRTIHPMVGWVSGRVRFHPNWEVERIVRIPLQAFLESRYYRRYRISFAPGTPRGGRPETAEYPCFVYPSNGRAELLWGATYRMMITFLDLVFGFSPPHFETLPVVCGERDDSYLKTAGRP